MTELTSWTEVWLVKVVSLIGEEEPSQELEMQSEFLYILSDNDIEETGMWCT
jgi:hypothetical protein